MADNILFPLMNLPIFPGTRMRRAKVKSRTGKFRPNALVPLTDLPILSAQLTVGVFVEAAFRRLSAA